MVCGETEVTASSLRSFTESLRDPVTDSGPTPSQQHLKVYSATMFDNHEVYFGNSYIGAGRSKYAAKV